MNQTLSRHGLSPFDLVLPVLVLAMAFTIAIGFWDRYCGTLHSETTIELPRPSLHPTIVGRSACWKGRSQGDPGKHFVGETLYQEFASCRAA